MKESKKNFYCYLFDHANNEIKQYIETQEGKRFLNKYLSICEAKPKNIYSSNNDFKQRYQKETFLLVFIACYINCCYSIPLSSIFEEIPEIRTFYKGVEILSWKFVHSFHHIFQSKKEWKQILLNEFKKYRKTIDKREYGEYYTSRQVIQLALSHLSFNLQNKVVDPSCGIGSFLLFYIKELQKRRKIVSFQDIKKIKENLYGYDIFPFPIILCKFILGLYFHEKFHVSEQIFQFKHIQIHNAMHSLTCRRKSNGEKFDLIIGNPPFFRIRKEDKNEICSCISYGHNYIQNLFLHWSIQHLNENGKICLILPQSILSGLYHQRLRKEILSKCHLDCIILNNKQEKFFSVQQDMIILYLSKPQNRKNTFCILSIDKDNCRMSSSEMDMKITKNPLSIIPIFKNTKGYQTLLELSKQPIIPLLKEVKLSTGNFIWNQNKNLIFKEPMPNTLPLISRKSILENQIFIDRNAKFSYCYPEKDFYIKRENAILFRRISPIENSHRMIASIIHAKEIPEYVVENHINIISYPNGNLEILKQILAFITSEHFNVLINAFCQSNQVSSNELKVIFYTLLHLHK